MITSFSLFLVARKFENILYVYINIFEKKTDERTKYKQTKILKYP